MESSIRITVRGDVDARAVEQLERCAAAGDALAGVLCADGHVGYSQPIGGALAYADYISPSGVGYDIACIAEGEPVSLDGGAVVPVEQAAGGGGWVGDGGGLPPGPPPLGGVAEG